MSSSCLGPSIRLWPFSFPPSCICRPRRALSIMSKWFPWQSPELLELLATQTGPYQLTTSMTSFSSYWGQICYCRREGLSFLVQLHLSLPSFIAFIACCSATFFFPSLSNISSPLLLYHFTHSFILFGYFCWKIEWMFFVEKSNCLWEEEGLWLQI